MTKINKKDFSKEFCKKLWKKNESWNIRRLVAGSFVQTNQRPSVIYHRLTDFYTSCLSSSAEEAVSKGGGEDLGWLEDLDLVAVVVAVAAKAL